MRVLKDFTLHLFFLSILLVSNVAAQDTSDVDYHSEISVKGKVAAKEIPLNRSLLFTVEVEWQGDFKRFQIGEVETPIVENFEIIATSATDRRSSENGITKAAKIYEFELKPESLGMGYIEGVVVKYIDTNTDEAHHIMTNRINVEVGDSVPEPGEHAFGSGWIILLVLLVVIAIAFLVWQARVKKRKRAEQEQVQVVSLEEEYLATLHGSVDLNSPDIVVNQALGSLSKILRRYLSQKYEIAALESTTDNIIQSLRGKDLDASSINTIEEVLNISDLAKFAGSEGDRQELDRVYTLIEAMLEKKFAESKLEKMEEEK